MKRKPILIITERDDADADLVIIRLRESGELPVRVNYDDDPADSFTLSLAGSAVSGVLRTRNRQIAIEDIRSAYCRAPQRCPAFPTGRTSDELFSQFEANCAWDSLFQAIECLWMNPPGLIHSPRYQPSFFRLARQIGVQTPPTLITSHPAEARRFANDHGGSIVFRPIGTQLMPESGDAGEVEPRRMMGPTLISSRMLEEHGSLISNGPCLFQKYVDKRRELRIVVVRDQVFAAAVESGIEAVRAPMLTDESMANGKLVEASLPDELQAKCIALVQKAGISYGVLDMAETPEGEHILLELNPHGSFACFHRHLPQLNVVGALAGVLSAGAAA